jgi:hypothetical protein
MAILGVSPSVVRVEVWGLVDIGGESIWLCGATKGTNNTREIIIGIGQALM